MNESLSAAEPHVSLPSWMNLDQEPKGETAAKPCWIGGHWNFIPFTKNGIPLRKLCATLEEARVCAAGYDNYLAGVEWAEGADAAQTVRDAYECISAAVEDELPSHYAVFELRIGKAPPLGMLLLRPDGSLHRKVIRDGERAVQLACMHAQETPQDGLRGP